MYLLNKIDKILLMDKIMLRIKKKLKSWELVYYILNHNYKQNFQFLLMKQAL